MRFPISGLDPACQSADVRLIDRRWRRATADRVLAQRGPAAVFVAAGRAARGSRLAVDSNGMRVLPAILRADAIRLRRHHLARSAASIAGPGYPLAALRVFQRLVFGFQGLAPVARAEPVTDRPGDQSADHACLAAAVRGRHVHGIVAALPSSRYPTSIHSRLSQENRQAAPHETSSQPPVQAARRSFRHCSDRFEIGPKLKLAAPRCEPVSVYSTRRRRTTAFNPPIVARPSSIVPPYSLDQIRNNRQAQPCAGLALVKTPAAFHRLARLVVRNARTVVLDGDRKHAVVVLPRCRRKRDDDLALPHFIAFSSRFPTISSRSSRSPANTISCAGWYEATPTCLFRALPSPAPCAPATPSPACGRRRCRAARRYAPAAGSVRAGSASTMPGRI